MMKYERTLSFKVSLEQHDRIVNYATERDMDVSDAMRKMIDDITQKEEDIIKGMEYYNYRYDTLKKRLDEIKQKKENNKKEDKSQKIEKSRKDDNILLEKEGDKIAQLIAKEYGEKFCGNVNKEEMEKAKEESIKLILTELKKKKFEKNDVIIKQILKRINKLFFKLEKEELL